MKEESILQLEDMSVYMLAVELSDSIWIQVTPWKFFEKDTIGKQMARAIDSIGANIAEGYGRFHYGDKVKFYYYARGSVYESQFWIKRSRARNLLAVAQSKEYLLKLQQISKELNTLIKTCKLRQIKK